jgi:cullin 3
MSRNNKFTIKPFQYRPPSSGHSTSMDQTSAMAAFSSLSTAIDEIHSRNASLLSFEELYRNAYNLVLHKHGGLLYDGVADRLGWHLEKSAESLVSMAAGLDTTSSSSEENEINASIAFLSALSSTWKEHRITMVMVRDIFMYMDRTYVQQNRKMTVYELGLFLFRRGVWEREMNDSKPSSGSGEEQHLEEGGQCLGHVASALLLRVIRRDRLDRLDDAPQRIALLRSCIHMLLELSMPSITAGNGDYSPRAAPSAVNIPVYERDFEEAFLGETQDFYRSESAGRLSHAIGLGSAPEAESFSSKPPAKYSAMEYVRLAKMRIEQEKARATSLDLPPPTRAQLQRIVETELIERHAKTLVDMEGSGFACLLKEVTGIAA